MNVIVRYTLYITIGYAFLVLAVFLLQRNLIYFPDNAKPSGQALNALGLRFWPRQVDYKGLTGIAPVSEGKGTVVVFHGNAGSAWHRDYFVKALEPLGYRVVLAEYPGYGGRPGKMSEGLLVDDANKTIDAAQTEFGGPIYLVGESMGCGVAAAAAADRSETIAGLVLITPWDTLADVAQTHYWYLPARQLVKDRFDSIAYLQSYTGPIAVAMAVDDEIIPNKHTMALYEALSSPKQLWRFENSGHNSWPTHPGASWWNEAMTFVSSTDR